MTMSRNSKKKKKKVLLIDLQFEYYLVKSQIKNLKINYKCTNYDG